ncbi:MAG: response regulator [Bacteroidia bacterium]|nr:response regulator [Bacteroidia bacterium]
MDSTQLRILLADDDLDDCFLFKEALDEFHISVSFTIVNDGEQLMQHLQKKSTYPDVLFIDMNMPRKNGFECLEEIKRTEKLKSIPVIIFSTYYDRDIVNMLYQKGAQYYIQKPREFGKLKKAIHLALSMTVKEKFLQPPLEQFVLSVF